MKELITSKAKYFHLLIGLLQSFLCSGIIYGWPSLLQIMEEEKILSDLCTPGEPTPCRQQNLRYQLIFTVGSFLNNCQAILSGLFMDKYGPLKTNLLASSLFLTGCLLFSISSIAEVDSLFWGFALISFAGPAVQLSLLHLSYLFERKSVLMTLFTGMFCASSVIFRIFLALHSQKLTLAYLFAGYIGILSPIMIIGFFLWPQRSYSYPSQPSRGILLSNK